IFVSLPKYSSVALLHVGGSPRCVQMMKRNEPLLDVRTGSHFLGATKENANTTSANIPKEHQLCGVTIMVLNECDLVRGNTTLDQFIAHVFINRKTNAIRRHRQVAEYKLRQSLFGGFSPDTLHLSDSKINFACWMIG